VKAFTAALGLVVAAACTPDSEVAPETGERISFVVAGHAYGAHDGTNVGLYPRFLEALGRQKRFDFVVLTGDVVRDPTEESYAAVLGELEAFGQPFYLVRGNHDQGPPADAVFQERHGGTHYSWSHGPHLFVVLDTRIRKYTVTPEQLTFLEDALGAQSYRNAFVFLHELLWLNPGRYPGILANPGDNPRSFQTNFWTEVFPVLQRHPDMAVYVIAGDVGGNRWAVPAFYDRVGHVRLVASGMGEVEDENLLRVDVDGADVTLTVVPLREHEPARPAEWWSVYNLRESR
jgi:3',5'-cyclic AMP phosphodiesterase CpdA